MSTRNPFRIYKDQLQAAARKAYGIKKLRDPWAIAEYAFDEVERSFSPKLRRQAFIALVLEIVTNRKEQTDFTTPDLFRDLEYLQIIKTPGGGSRAIELGDFGLDEIDAVNKQKDANISAATNEKIRWQRHCAVIVPLLQKHPDWKWRDACNWLKKHGGFPVL